MATLKKRNRLGTPPPQTDTLDNLSVPEVVPVKQEKMVDGRTLRKKGNVQFNTKVSKEYLKKVRLVAKNEGRTIGKILELSLESYAGKKISDI